MPRQTCARDFCTPAVQYWLSKLIIMIKDVSAVQFNFKPPLGDTFSHHTVKSFPFDIYSPRKSKRATKLVLVPTNAVKPQLWGLYILPCQRKLQCVTEQDDSTPLYHVQQEARTSGLSFLLHRKIAGSNLDPGTSYLSWDFVSPSKC